MGVIGLRSLGPEPSALSVVHDVPLPIGLTEFRQGVYRWRRHGESRLIHGTREAAVEQAIVYNHQLKAGSLPPVHKRQSFGDFCDHWLASRNVRESSRERYREILAAFREATDAKPLSVNVVYGYIMNLPSTARYYHRLILRALFRDAVAAGVMRENFTDTIKLPKPTAVDREASHHPLTAGEVERFLEAARSIDSDWAEAAEVFIYSGMRKQELNHLEWTDIDFKAGTIRIAPKANWRPKATSGVIPMHSRVRAILERRRALNQPFKLKSHNQWLRLTYQTAAKAGLGHVRLHDLRHTYATLLRSRGVGIETIKELMRHSDIRQTLQYAKASQSELATAVNRI